MAEKPFLAAAFLCEKILQEKDETLTAVRIIDTVFVSIPPGLPTGAKPVIQLTALLSFKKATKGVDTEPHQAVLLVHTPSGRELPPYVVNFFFKPEEFVGHNLIVNITLALEEFGVFGIDVSVDGEPITRMPFRLLEKAANSPELIH